MTLYAPSTRSETLKLCARRTLSSRIAAVLCVASGLSVFASVGAGVPNSNEMGLTPTPKFSALPRLSVIAEDKVPNIFTTDPPLRSVILSELPNLHGLANADALHGFEHGTFDSDGIAASPYAQTEMASLNVPETLPHHMRLDPSVRLPSPSHVPIWPSVLHLRPTQDAVPHGDASDAPEQQASNARFSVRMDGGERLEQVLLEYGVSAHDREASMVALRADDIPTTLSNGDCVDIALGDVSETGRLLALRLRLKQGREVELRWVPAEDAVWADLDLASPYSDEELIDYRPVSVAEALGEAALHGGQADRVFLQGVIETSLYDAAIDSGMTPGETETLGKIFQYMIDFERDLQRGDRFEVLFEKKPNGDYGDIAYASVTNRGKTLSLYLSENEFGAPEYFDAFGKTNKRSIMKTPVAYARVSSGYGMRRHPILGYHKMHRGVDFAAPTGTPVLAAGDGIVEYVGRRGTYGNYVRIKHSNGFKTAYAHLSRFASDVKKGDRVMQGEVIAYVGSTGRSTGPHLHFEVIKHDKQVNPRKVGDFGTIKGIEGRKRAVFLANVARTKLILEELRPRTIVSAQ